MLTPCALCTHVNSLCFLSLFCRAASLAHVNAMLREQLDQATSANQQLTSDIHKLTQDWQRAREELEAKENEWRDEEQVGRISMKIEAVVLTNPKLRKQKSV